MEMWPHRGLTLLTISLLVVALFFFAVCSFDSLAYSYHDNKKRELESQPQLVVTNSDASSAVLYGIRNSAHHDSLFRHSTLIQKQVGNMSMPSRKVEMELARARISIRDAMRLKINLTSSSLEQDAPRGTVYRNSHAFYQSYLEMEKYFKVYVYEEGLRPIVHDGPCKDIYTSEGRFIHEMELATTKFRTRDVQRAHVYFMPFSVSMMVKFLCKPNSMDKSPLLNFVSDYVQVISTKYPFWNRSQGADHFMLSCHDWAPDASSGNPWLYSNSIRVLCNANTSEGFDPRKDATLPEIYLYDGNMSPDLIISNPAAADMVIPKKYLAFFAGGLHGPIRPLLFQHWKNRDADLLVHEYLPKNLNYYSLMLSSKFCLCPSGYEVASPRIVEAIYAECVPVVITQDYVLPFSDVLRWEAFSVQIKVSDIANLKQILSAIPTHEYLILKEGVKAVKKHFMLNQPPKRFDVFHMILHSIWLRRLNVRLW